MISVVHIIDHMGLGGVQTFLRTILPQLRQYGYAPQLINLRGTTTLSQELERTGIPVLSLDLPRWSSKQYSQLVRELERIRPEIVHTHLTVSSLVGRLAAIKAGVPAIIMEDQISVSQEIAATPAPIVLAYRLIEPWLAQYTTMYISPSVHVLQASQVAKRWPAEKCQVRPNGVNCAHFTPAVNRAAMREQIGLENRPTVTTLGRFVAQKRMHDVIHIAKQIIQHIPDVQFLIGGGGPLETALHQAIAEAQLQDHVKLIGHVQHTSQILAASDIYLSVSGGEVLSLAILEAMASGCPIVATNCGGTAEQVFPQVNGFLSTVGDIQALSQGVLTLLRDQNLRDQYGHASRRIAQEQFDFSNIVRAQASIYTKLRYA